MLNYIDAAPSRGVSGGKPGISIGRSAAQCVIRPVWRWSTYRFANPDTGSTGVLVGAAEVRCGTTLTRVAARRLVKYISATNSPGVEETADLVSFEEVGKKVLLWRRGFTSIRYVRCQDTMEVQRYQARVERDGCGWMLPLPQLYASTSSSNATWPPRKINPDLALPR